MNEIPPSASGKILLVFTSGDPQTAVQLAATAGISAADTALQLHRLIDQGFVIAASADAAGVSVYRLNPKGVRTEEGAPRQRVLVIDDTVDMQELMGVILEGQGYVVVATALQADAVALLQEIAFDLVLTDGFSPKASAVFVSSADVIEAAGATPVALFSAHRVELGPTLAAGFRDLIAKPFDIDRLERQVRTLLGA